MCLPLPKQKQTIGLACCNEAEPVAAVRMSFECMRPRMKEKEGGGGKAICRDEQARLMCAHSWTHLCQVMTVNVPLSPGLGHPYALSPMRCGLVPFELCPLSVLE